MIFDYLIGSLDNGVYFILQLPLAVSQSVKCRRIALVLLNQPAY